MTSCVFDGEFKFDQNKTVVFAAVVEPKWLATIHLTVHVLTKLMYRLFASRSLCCPSERNIVIGLNPGTLLMVNTNRETFQNLQAHLCIT